MYIIIKYDGASKYYWNASHKRWEGLVDNATPVDAFWLQKLLNQFNLDGDDVDYLTSQGTKTATA